MLSLVRQCFGSWRCVGAYAAASCGCTRYNTRNRCTSSLHSVYSFNCLFCDCSPATQSRCTRTNLFTVPYHDHTQHAPTRIYYYYRKKRFRWHNVKRLQGHKHKTKQNSTSATQQNEQSIY